MQDRSTSSLSTTAVLLSGGLDSAVLVAEEAARAIVQPVYVSVGLAWEGAEQTAARQFLDRSMLGDRVLTLVCLSVDMTDVYPASHWARQGRPPAYHTPDEDVYLPGRNIVLLGKAAVFCATAGIERLAIGTLDHNPFPDATVEFRASMSRALSLGLGRPLEVVAPYAEVGKADVIRRGRAAGVKFELTLSCMSPRPATAVPGNPVMPTHCGVCSKCRERHDGFVEAGVPDPTSYADTRYTIRTAAP